VGDQLRLLPPSNSVLPGRLTVDVLTSARGSRRVEDVFGNWTEDRPETGQRLHSRNGLTRKQAANLLTKDWFTESPVERPTTTSGLDHAPGDPAAPDGLVLIDRGCPEVVEHGLTDHLGSVAGCSGATARNVA
jgi:hypothetical protein